MSARGTKLPVLLHHSITVSKARFWKIKREEIITGKHERCCMPRSKLHFIQQWSKQSVSRYMLRPHAWPSHMPEMSGHSSLPDNSLAWSPERSLRIDGVDTDFDLFRLVEEDWSAVEALNLTTWLLPRSSASGWAPRLTSWKENNKDRMNDRPLLSV